MGEIFAKLAQGLAGAGKKAATAVATGSTQASLGLQSPHLATTAIRIGRFLYTVTLGWIFGSYYTGYVNERTKTGTGPTFVLPGSNLPVINSPDRPDKSVASIIGDTLGGGKNGGGAGIFGIPNLPVPQGPVTGIPFSPIKYDGSAGSRTLVALSPQQLGTPGTAMPGYLWSAPSGDKQLPPYSAERYRSLVHLASAIAKSYGLTISSGYRAGDSGSLHGSGIAFDMVGRVTDMKRADSWAAQNPGLFQEIFIHNEGSGLHLHLGFYPDAADIVSKGQARYNRAGSGPSAAPAASRHPTQFV